MPAARALIVWMVGEYNSIGEIIPKMLPTVLKYLAWCFTTESLEAKLQILNTAVKVGRMGEFVLISPVLKYLHMHQTGEELVYE